MTFKNFFCQKALLSKTEKIKKLPGQQNAGYTSLYAVKK